MEANIKTVEEKLNFYKNALKDKNEIFVLVCNGDTTTPLCVYKTKASDVGFAEMKCQLLGPLTFAKGNAQQEKFMKEQKYYVVENVAYDIQPNFSIEPFDKYFGEFETIGKERCIKTILNQKK